MKKIDIVIGGQYGDEGKGSFTSFLSDKNTVSVRFNGGSQAGHTVLLNGIRHVCSSYCSNVLKSGITYWSEFFVVNPIAFYAETKMLQQNNIETPKILSNPGVLITTPFDIALNRIKELKRKNKHGSVGHGFFETLKRDETHPDMSIKVSDCHDGDLVFKKLVLIEQWFHSQIKQLNVSNVNFVTPTNVEIDDYLYYVNCISNSIQIDLEYKELNNFNHIVFEGAQGLYLDKNNIDEFPHLTYSNTGSANVRSILSNLTGVGDINRYYITRPYTTKHGAGKLEYEVDLLPFEIIDETNKFNKHQGELRFANLNFKKLINYINNDISQLETTTNNLCISCMDQTDYNIHTTDGTFSLNLLESLAFDSIFTSHNHIWRDEKYEK